MMMIPLVLSTLTAGNRVRAEATCLVSLTYRWVNQSQSIANRSSFVSNAKTTSALLDVARRSYPSFAEVVRAERRCASEIYTKFLCGMKVQKRTPDAL